MALSSNIGAPARPQHSPQTGARDRLQPVSVIPAKAGIQRGESPSLPLDPRFREGDEDADSSGNRPARVRRAIGLMSGTSHDGIDVALIETDGRDRVIPGPWITVAYRPDFREKLRSVLGGAGPVLEVEDELTRLHGDAVEQFLRRNPATAVDVVGFHGHTILHRPAERRTWQIGDGAALAARLELEVVANFRSADVAAGGEGAPLAPLFHAALAASLQKPLAILNLGGVANVTWIGETGQLLAFDTGPGNAMIDDWVQRHTGATADFGGVIAGAGRASAAHIKRFLASGFFDRQPPKSLDRDDFRDLAPIGLSLEDGAATLTEMTAAAVATATRHFPLPAQQWLITGGGRHNPILMEALQHRLGVPVRPVEAAGWEGDPLEAQAFAYLAVRSLEGLPLSLPSTTGVPEPTHGGRLFSHS